MNRILSFLYIAIFSIFIGSQITEGVLLVPYWKRLSTSAFYEYYDTFGPSIGRFYTILTIIAALIPIGLSLYCFLKKSRALKYALVSLLFAVLFIAVFYIYFKDANQQFYDMAFDANQLQSELTNWENWHWLRVLFEVVSLVFLMLSLHILNRREAYIEQ